MAGEKVLVIDDHKDSVEFVVDCVLVPNGYQPLTARDGEEGLHKALTEEPDLILLDLQMPKMSGTEVLEALQEAECYIPVVLMTFRSSEELAVRLFRLGVKDYVIKPFQVEEMLEAIEGALTEVRLRRERQQLTASLIQLNRQLDRRVKELSILYGIGKSVSSLLNPEKLLERIVEAAVYITGAEEGSLLLLDAAKGELLLGAAQGLDERYTSLFRFKVEGSIAGEVVKTGQPVALSGAIEVRTDYRVKALLNTPLKLKGQIIGVLGVYNRVADRPFIANDLYLLSGLSDYAAIAIENTRLLDQAQHRGQELTFLSEIGRAVTSTLNLEQVLTMILEEACRVLEVDIASILLRDDETGELIFEMAVGPGGAELQGVRLPPGRGVAGWVADHGQPLIVSEARADPRFYPEIDELINFYTKSLLCVPLKVKDRVIGVVEVLNKAGRGFTEDDLRLLSSLAASAAIAIENARLFDALQELREREKGYIRNLFQHYLAPVVVDRLLSDSEQTVLRGRRQEITTLFADIRGFTALSEKISPENLVEVLNRYLSLAAQAVLDYGGTLDKFMGDTVMAFFNAPLAQENHTMQAVRAALAMQRAVADYHCELDEELRLSFSVGISAGEAVVGNVGMAQLMDYTAIGQCVNLARQLQEQAGAGQVLLSQRAYEAVGDAVRVRALEPIQIRGQSTLEPVYEVLSLEGTPL